jgi:hypothetical protein
MPEFAVPTNFTVREGLTRFFAQGAAGATKFETMVKGAFDRSGKSASMFRQIVGGVTLGNLAADGIRRGAAAISNLAQEGLKLASDLIEVQNVVDTSFGPAGAAKINAWSQAAMRGFGLSELQAKQFTGTMGAMLKSSGITGGGLVSMSTRIAGLAGDFASFYNLPIEEAFMKIRSGISGEIEPLRQLGVNMSVANLQAFALTQGIRKKWEKMKQGEQVQLRYNYLMKVSADAQGDFAKTLNTSVANQARVFDNMKRSTAANFMSAMLPLQMQFYQTMNSRVLPVLSAWITKNKDLIATKIERTLTTVWWVVKNLGPPILAGALAFQTLKTAMLAAAFAGKIFAVVNTIVFAFQAVAGGAATKMEALNMVMRAHPVGLVCTALSILIALFMLLSSKVGGPGNAFRVIGETIMKFSFLPLNMMIDSVRILMDLLSHVPGLGKLGEWSQQAGALQSKMNTYFTGSASAYDINDPYKRARSAELARQAPNQAQVERQDSSFSGVLQIAGAPDGSTLATQSKGPDLIRAYLMGENP